MTRYDHPFETVTEFAPNAVPDTSEIIVECHQPLAWHTSVFHQHSSIELNYLDGCEMVYSFSGNEIVVPEGKLIVFWAAHPHRVVRVNGTGKITNAYISLAQLLRWHLPDGFVSSLLAGSVISSRKISITDNILMKNLADEKSSSDAISVRLRAVELEARFLRLVQDGWTELFKGNFISNAQPSMRNQTERFEQMLTFTSKNFVGPIGVKDIAAHAGISATSANSIFRKFLGQSIKTYLQNVRLNYAKMLLLETDTKILTIALNCGFSSQSSFYEAFRKYTGCPPAKFRHTGINIVDTD